MVVVLRSSSNHTSIKWETKEYAHTLVFLALELGPTSFAFLKLKEMVGAWGFGSYAF